ncbi:MAG: universal stress protein [Desulfobacteraceae bacterium]|nr:MAG: universal stress protein [Desulfobacteraceae bacterium]
MIKLLVYTDGKPDALRALHFAAQLKKRLKAELGVITIRPGTHAAEEPPPIGVSLTADQSAELPRGLHILRDAARVLVDETVLAPIDSIIIRDIPKGHIFVCKGLNDERIPFYECFGSFVEVINKEIEEHHYQMLIAAPPQRSKLGRLVVGNTTRKLALDLHTSLLVVRGGGPDSRFMVCLDGSPSAHRQFPLLEKLLPAIVPPIDLLFVRPPEAEAQLLQEAEACLQRAKDWLYGCGKLGTIMQREGSRRTETVIETAGDDAVIVMGASLRHDVYRRMLGALPLQVLERTPASVLLVKQLPEDGTDFMKDPFTCG